MQTQTLDNKGESLAPYNDVAELIDREMDLRELTLWCGKSGEEILNSITILTRLF